MSLTPGARLGPYEILSPLGAGGMGEVFKGRDTRLDRTVAIKVLAEHVASDPELKERFEREARTISSLNHPHICTLYDVGSQDGIDFLVMEYLEGQTLADRLLQGALPLDVALQQAIHIADALAKAHRAGIIHRDLKPGNIMLTKSGVKLLDFGLAKAVGPAPSTNLSRVPTTPPKTQRGTILGTLQYMAPEQLEGIDADVRTDIFAFGAVLHEMLTGKAAFEGKSQASLISAIMSNEPPAVSSLQPVAPPVLDQIIRTCLAKDPDERWQTVGDIERQLKWIVDGRQTHAQVMVAAPGGARWPPLIKALTIIFVGCVLGTIVVGAAIWRAIRPMVSAPERLSIVLPTDHPVAFGWVPGRSLAISPDGTQIAYVSTILELPSDTSGNRRLLLRSLGDRSVRDLPGTAGAVQPFFSSDNKWIGFFTHTGDLKKISLAGGNPVTLLEKINGAFWAVGVWAGDNTIIFGTRQKGLERISADGGRSQNVTTIDAGQNETSHTTPTLVGSRAVLFSVIFNNRLQDPRIDAVTLDTGERRVVVENGRDPHYLASGHLLFQRGETLLVAPFDAKGLTLTGPAVPFVDEIRRDGADGTGQVPQLVVSDNGTVAYVPGVETTSALVQVSRSGASAVIGPAPDRFDFPRISPNGQYVAFQIQQGRRTIVHVYDVVRGTTTRLTQDGTDFSPSWHPNSRQLAVTSGKTDISGIFLKDLNGTERLLVPNPGTTTFVRNSSWSPDGRVLAYTVQTGSLHDIWVVTADDKSSAQPLLNGPATEHTPAFSPDGRWLAYVSDQSGRAEVYVRRYPQGDTLSVSSGGGQGPVWGRDGREIFFQGSYEGNAKLMVVSVDMTGNTLRLGRPTPLLDMRVPGSTGAIEQYAGSNNQGPGYDIFPDGKRFVMIRRADPRGTREIVLIQNFFEELKRLVPTK